MESLTIQPNFRLPIEVGQSAAPRTDAGATGVMTGLSGFLLGRSAGPQGEYRVDRIAPQGARFVIRRQLPSGLEQLLCWGQSGGDVHFRSDGNGFLTLLSGYVFAVSGGPEFGDQAEAVAHLHARLGADEDGSRLRELAPQLYGSFALVQYNARTGAVICTSDRMGSRPLWMKLGPSGWLLSSHAVTVALAAGLTSLDLGAVGSLLLYGGQVEPQKSLFEGVQALPSGTVRIINESGRISDSHWYTFRHTPRHGRSLADWANLAAERLTVAASRIVKACPEPAVFLSGGVDSRLAAAAIKSAGGNPLLVTLGDAVNLEVRIAQRAAKALGLRHEVLLRDKTWYLRGLASAAFESGGSYVWTHAHFSRAARDVQLKHDRTTFVLGDFSEAFSKLLCAGGSRSGTPWEPEQFGREFDRILLPLYRPAHQQFTLALLKPGLRAEVEAAVRENIINRYAKLLASSRDPLILGDLFNRWEAVASCPTFMMFLDLRSAGPERNLMFDPVVHSLLEILPSDLRGGGNLGSRIVSRLCRSAGWVTNANSLLPMCWPADLHQLSKACKPVFGKVRRWWMGNPYTTTGSWPNRTVLYRDHPGWRRQLEILLVQSEWLDPALFDRDAVRRHWQDFLLGESSCCQDIERLACVAMVSQLAQVGATKFLEDGLSPELREDG